MNYEERIRSLQWKWTAAHTTIKRYEGLLREFRLTSIGMFVLMISSAVFLPRDESSSNILLSFSAILWASIYTITLGPHIISNISGRRPFEEDLDELRHEYADFEEITIELERALYTQRKYYRYVRMATMLSIYAVLMSAAGFAYLYLLK